MPAPTADPWVRSLPPGRFDAVVIGSGMGGLTTAAMLAAVGRRVLVVERHLRPGGFTQTFRRGAARWDVGVHVVGEVGPDVLPGRLLSRLTNGRLRWASIGTVVDRVIDEDGVVAELPAGLDAMTAALARACPGSERAARRYLTDAQQTSAALGRSLLARSMPTAARAFANGPEMHHAQEAIAMPARTALLALPEALRPLMALRWGYMGTPLDDLSAAGLASATAHFIDGGYYPVGGAGEIARTLAAPVVAAGGAVLVGNGVAALRLDGDGVVGVRLDSGEEVDAPAIVSAMGAHGTLQLLGERAPAAWRAELEALPLTMSHVALYLALKEDPREWGVDGANYWAMEAESREVGWYASFPSIRDPSWKGPHLASVIRLVPWAEHAHFPSSNGRPSAAYSAYKAELGKWLLGEVCRRYPRMAGAVQHMEVAVPATVCRYIGAPEGATYGLAVTPERLRSPALKAITPVPGLYLSGSDVVLPGVVGAMLGGVPAAVAIGGGAAMRLLLECARTAPFRPTPP